MGRGPVTGRWVVLVAILLGYAAVIAYAVLIAGAWSVNRLFVQIYYSAVSLGLPRWITPQAYAMLANLVMLLPLAYAPVVLWSRLSPWVPVFVLTAASGAVELAQKYVIGTRHGDTMDFLLNSAGAVLGALAGLWHRSRRRRRADSLVSAP